MHDATGSVAATFEYFAGGLRMIPLLFFCDPCESEVNGEVFRSANVVDQFLPHGFILLFPIDDFGQKGCFSSGICGFADHGFFGRLFEVFENRIHRVIIFHHNRIGLVLVASRASDGGGKKSTRYHIHTIIDRFDRTTARTDGNETKRGEVRVIGPISN